MIPWPPDLERVRETPIFDEKSVPAGLLRRHTTKGGTWALIEVLEGELLYRVLEGEPHEELLTPGRPGRVAPEVPHEVEPRGRVRFRVVFHRQPEGSARARLPSSVEGVASVELLRGESASDETPIDLLVEVPHGADERAHYDALRAALKGPLPDDLHVFFHANTDIGAYAYGRRVAELALRARPSRKALIVRALIPRTFIDPNRVEGAADELSEGGLSPALPSYVTDPDDAAHLVELHRRYVGIAEEAYAAVCGSGGFALCPHSYGPRTLPIERVDAEIVRALRAAHEPEAFAAAPERPHVDLITHTPEGARLAPLPMVEALLTAYRAMGLEAVEGTTYVLHPSTQGHRYATRFPGQTFCLELRRDLLVERYTPFEEMRVDPAKAERMAAPIAGAIDAWLSEAGR